MEYYHILKLWDGEEIRVKPSAVDAVNRYLDNKDGFIPTATRRINVKEVRDFNLSDVPYDEEDSRQQKLIESSEEPSLLLQDAAEAFNTPLTSGDGVKCRAVKKSVSLKAWDTLYSKQTYVLVGKSDNYAVIAWWQPVHQKMRLGVDHCNPDEEALLRKGARGEA
jgi:hypothetical protein